MNKNYLVDCQCMMLYYLIVGSTERPETKEIKMTYYTTQGDVVTSDQIKAAVEAGTARIIYSHNPDGGLYHSLTLKGEDIDTRGQCYQMAEEQWTVKPSYQDALRAARGG